MSKATSQEVKRQEQTEDQENGPEQEHLENTADLEKQEQETQMKTRVGTKEMSKPTVQEVKRQEQTEDQENGPEQEHLENPADLENQEQETQTKTVILC